MNGVNRSSEKDRFIVDVSIIDVTSVEKEMQVNLTVQELTPHFDSAYKRYQPKMEIKGFRKGKAPLDLVKKIYGESIEYDSLNTIANDVYRQIVEERNIRPIGEPALTDMDYKRGVTLTFKVKYEIKPTFELKEYKNIPVEKPVHRVTEQELEQEILRLRNAHSTFSETQSASDDEHIVTVDAQELDSTGSPLIGKKSSDMRLHLADESLSKEIKETLRGVTPGETKRVKIETNHKDHQHTLHLQLTVKKVEKIQLPEFNDEFIKKLTKDNISSVVEFRKKLEEDVENYWKDQSERKVHDAIISEIVRRHEFTVPESLAKSILDSMLEEIKSRYPNKKLPENFNEQKFREENRSYAVFQATWLLIREQIIQAEQLQVDDAELERLAETDAPNMGLEKERLLKFYRSSDSVKERVLSQKLTKLLSEHAKITENVTEEPFD